jgi:hypothetical protein
VVFGDPGIAATVGAKAFAIGQMNINTYPLFAIAFGKRHLHRFFPIRRIKQIRFPVGHRRVASVTGRSDIIFF